MRRPSHVGVIGFVLCCRSDRGKIDREDAGCECVWDAFEGRFREGDRLERSGSEVKPVILTLQRFTLMSV